MGEMRLIDANRVLEDMKNNMDSHTFKEWKEYIDSIPAIDAEPVRHGKWIMKNEMYGEYECSECKFVDSNCSDYYGMHWVKDQNYCPHCGAKMDKEEE